MQGQYEPLRSIDWIRARRAIHVRAEALRARLARESDGPRFVEYQQGRDGQTVQVPTPRGHLVIALGDLLAARRALRDAACRQRSRGRRGMDV